jgi:hypothetical protein
MLTIFYFVFVVDLAINNQSTKILIVIILLTTLEKTDENYSLKIKRLWILCVIELF